MDHFLVAVNRIHRALPAAQDGERTSDVAGRVEPSPQVQPHLAGSNRATWRAALARAPRLVQPAAYADRDRWWKRAGKSNLNPEHRFWDLGQTRLSLAGRPLVMGILNVTPDSFSDGGRLLDADGGAAFHVGPSIHHLHHERLHGQADEERESDEREQVARLVEHPEQQKSDQDRTDDPPHRSAVDRDVDVCGALFGCPVWPLSWTTCSEVRAAGNPTPPPLSKPYRRLVVRLRTSMRPLDEGLGILPHCRRGSSGVEQRTRNA